MADITEKKKDETAGKRGIFTSHPIKESMKGLRCLYDVARISGAPDKTINERLTEITAILPQGFESPNCWARITLAGDEFKTNNYCNTKNMISANILVQWEKAGAVEIGCLQTPPSAGNSFTGQEILLLETVSERLGTIIEHRRADDALRESEQKFSKAFHASPAIMTISGVEDGRLIDVNDSFIRFSGYTRAEALKLTTVETGRWLQPEERTLFLKNLQEQGVVWEMEITSHTKNGELRFGLISADLITLRGKRCILSVTQDITELKQSREFLETISRSSPLGIYILQNEKLIYSSVQFQEITGYSQQELLGFNLKDLIAAADIDVVMSSTTHTLQEKKPYPCEYRILNKNGHIKWVMQTVSPIHYDGTDALLGNIMDITERKYLERQVTEYEELNKMKGDILATVSHELRTPLAAVKGYVTMLLDYYSKISPEEAMEHLILINNSADGLIELVDNLLDTSRMDSGLLELKKAPASISALVKFVVKISSIRISNHHITTTLPEYLPRVFMDIKRLRQVLENLLNDAARYSPEGTEINITARKKENNIEVSVTHQGDIIPPGEIKYIFDRMYKAENRAHAGKDGMGLSLHICQRVVEAHGGHIRAESSPETGTSICFTLPMMPRKKRESKGDRQDRPIKHIL